MSRMLLNDLYSDWWDKVVKSEAKAAAVRSAQRYCEIIEGKKN